jgi:tRNA (adenine22-N1)-methyltransferase
MRGNLRLKLKGRLGLIAGKVPSCDVVCDIGTDHGYIPIYLVCNRICKRAIAVDINKGPIFAAQENIRHFSLSDSIETRLGDGLKPINEGEADVIVIAGMGGILISEILAEGINKVRSASALVLQPMNAVEVLRKWLFKNGYQIYDEELVNEGEKLYTIISTRWTGNINKVDEINFYVGEPLIEKRDPLLCKYIGKKLKQVEGVLEDLEKINRCDDQAMTEYKMLKSGYNEILQRLNKE